MIESISLTELSELEDDEARRALHLDHEEHKISAQKSDDESGQNTLQQRHKTSKPRRRRKPSPCSSLSIHSNMNEDEKRQRQEENRLRREKRKVRHLKQETQKLQKCGTNKLMIMLGKAIRMKLQSYMPANKLLVKTQLY